MPNLVPYSQRNSLFRNSFMSPFFQQSNFAMAPFKLDIENNENEYVITADMPGASRDEITLSFHNSRLAIAVEKKSETEKSEKNYVHRERSYRSASRVVFLPGSDAESVKAKLEDGVLTVTVAKSQQAPQTKQIEIE